MPRRGDDCEIVRARGMLIDTTEVDGEENTEEDDEEDDGDDHYGFFSLIQGALDRLRVYSLRVSIEIEVPCSDGTTCEQSRCVAVSGIDTNLALYTHAILLQDKPHMHPHLAICHNSLS